MTCYICDPERKTPAAQAMSDDDFGEGCDDCERSFWKWVANGGGPVCDACDRPAAWAYIGESGDLYLCVMHNPGSATGWRSLTTPNPQDHAASDTAD